MSPYIYVAVVAAVIMLVVLVLALRRRANNRSDQDVEPVKTGSSYSGGSREPHNVIDGKYVPPSEDFGSGGSQPNSPTNYSGFD